MFNLHFKIIFLILDIEGENKADVIVFRTIAGYKFNINQCFYYDLFASGQYKNRSG